MGVIDHSATRTQRSCDARFRLIGRNADIEMDTAPAALGGVELIRNHK
jgi:hypothetical protein